MNAWNIPARLEEEVRSRDTTCVYCRVPMVERMPPREPRSAVATWEHIINDARLVSHANIARCCVTCNSSKGAKPLVEWLESDYCKRRGIGADTVADVVRQALTVLREQAERR